MFYAEILSGASQLWYLNPFGVFYTLPLYLLHTIILLSIALRLKRTKLHQLYILGMIFALYEAVITKVLWAGYMNEVGPAIGPWLGIAPLEFVILVFFWHPIFSFILPILTYEKITGASLKHHTPYISKVNPILVLFAISLIATFVANGNQYNLISANLAVIGSLLLIVVVYGLSRHHLITIKEFEFLPKFIYILLFIVYVLGAWWLVPERFPSSIIAYVFILISYFVFVGRFILSKRDEDQTIESLAPQSKMIGFIPVLILIFFINLWTLISNVSEIILTITYLLLALLGFILFIYGFILNRDLQS
jgi:hypothetical protein